MRWPRSSRDSRSHPPMTSMMNVRSCALAVSAMRSQASTIVFMAVSTPMAKPVSAISLSIEAGIPMHRTGQSFASSGSLKSESPASEPFPPMTMRPVHPLLRQHVAGVVPLCHVMKALAPGRVQNRPALTQDVVDLVGGDRDELTIEQAFVSLAHAEHAMPFGGSPPSSRRESRRSYPANHHRWSGSQSSSTRLLLGESPLSHAARRAPSQN